MRQLKYLRSLLLICTACNVFSAVQLMYKCMTFRPNIIRFHSISRFHGRLPILLSWCCPAKKMMMYHDLGYFHPYPSKLTEESQILPRGIKNWFLMTKQITNNPIRLFFSFLKFFNILFLRFALLYTVDKHLVPSDFMVKYLVDWWVKKSSINVLPHFIQCS